MRRCRDDDVDITFIRRAREDNRGRLPGISRRISGDDYFRGATSRTRQYGASLVAPAHDFIYQRASRVTQLSKMPPRR